MKNSKTSEVRLISLSDFRRGMKKILSVTKKESDQQLADFHESNAKKRTAKKKR
jgi:hypothetical protein